jgi:hypothetical protein
VNTQKKTQISSRRWRQSVEHSLLRNYATLLIPFHIHNQLLHAARYPDQRRWALEGKKTSNQGRASASAIVDSSRCCLLYIIQYSRPFYDHMLTPEATKGSMGPYNSNAHGEEEEFTLQSMMESQATEFAAPLTILSGPVDSSISDCPISNTIQSEKSLLLDEPSCAVRQESAEEVLQRSIVFQDPLPRLQDQSLSYPSSFQIEQLLFNGQQQPTANVYAVDKFDPFVNTTERNVSVVGCNGHEEKEEIEPEIVNLEILPASSTTSDSIVDVSEKSNLAAKAAIRSAIIDKDDAYMIAMKRRMANGGDSSILTELPVDSTVEHATVVAVQNVEDIHPSELLLLDGRHSVHAELIGPCVSHVDDSTSGAYLEPCEDVHAFAELSMSAQGEPMMDSTTLEVDSRSTTIAIAHQSESTTAYTSSMVSDEGEHAFEATVIDSAPLYQRHMYQPSWKSEVADVLPEVQGSESLAEALDQKSSPGAHLRHHRNSMSALDGDGLANQEAEVLGIQEDVHPSELHHNDAEAELVGTDYAVGVAVLSSHTPHQLELQNEGHLTPMSHVRVIRQTIDGRSESFEHNNGATVHATLVQEQSPLTPVQTMVATAEAPAQDNDCNQFRTPFAADGTPIVLKNDTEQRNSLWPDLSLATDPPSVIAFVESSPPQSTAKTVQSEMDPGVRARQYASPPIGPADAPSAMAFVETESDRTSPLVKHMESEVDSDVEGPDIPDWLRDDHGNAPPAGQPFGTEAGAFAAESDVSHGSSFQTVSVFPGVCVFGLFDKEPLIIFSVDIEYFYSRNNKCYGNAVWGENEVSIDVS